MRKNRLFLLLLLLVSLFTLAACQQGLQGEPGDKGAAGDKGITGDTGATGDKGADGQDSKAPEFKVDNDGLQWRFEGAEEWNVLITIPDLIGYSEKYTISFDTNGGDALEALANQVWKTTAELPAATKEGYTFLGWQKIEEGALEGEVYAENKYPNVQGDVELKAVWGATVSYAEETAKEAAVLKAGESTTLPALEAAEGKTFLGWTCDGYTLEAAGAEVTPTTNRHYVPVYNYTITYELNGGEGSTTEDVATAEVGELPTPTKAGHVFQGWYKDTELTQVVESKPLGEVTLYAKWLEATYVNYNLNGGTFAIAPYASIDAFAEEIIALFNSTGISDAKVTTRAEFVSTTHPNVKYVFSKAENLEKYKWLIQLALDAVNEGTTGDYVTAEIQASVAEMLTKMLAGDTEAINGSYADGRTAFRQFIHRLINIGGTEGNTAYNTITTDFTVEENLAEVYEIMGLPAPKYADVDACIADLLADLTAYYGTEATKDNVHNISETAAVTMFDFFLTHETYSAKWGWLAEYMIAQRAADATQSAGAQNLKDKSNAHWRYEVWAFLNKGQRASWPYSANYADANVVAAFAAANGSVKQVLFTENAALATPTKEGYIFAGWFNAEGNEVKSVTIGDGNTTINVTAKWQAYHNVSFDLDGGCYLNPAEGTNTFVAGAYDAINWGNYNTYISAGSKGRAWWYHVTLKETAVAGIYEVTGKGSSGSSAATFAEGEIGLLYCDDHKTSIPELFALVSGLKTGQLISVSNLPTAATNAASINVEVYSADSSLENFTIVYTEDVAALPVPVKEGFNFLGWFNGETKVENITITESATYTLVAKWEAAASN